MYSIYVNNDMERHLILHRAVQLLCGICLYIIYTMNWQVDFFLWAQRLDRVLELHVTYLIIFAQGHHQSLPSVNKV